ncbi:MAG: 4Fe-4S binding protein, partial [Hydrogenophaga sp.]|uniref:4Fe-4S binding protein n=1 Tax=Hydrogenophaga sp. TaxID=1904254 RepID=UPI004036CFFC
MIEIVSPERCTGCNICVSACPTQVFEAVPGGIPRIARQSDCQTCFMCELYCPTDALYVAPVADHAVTVAEEGTEVRQWIGSYRRAQAIVRSLSFGRFNEAMRRQADQ